MSETATPLHPARRWLGREVRDLITGVTGICSSVSQQPGGNFMVSITPRTDKDNVWPDAQLVDEVTAEETGPGISDRLVDVDERPAFEIGDRAEHVASNFTGTVMARSWWLNGCVQFIVASLEVAPHNGQLVSQAFLTAELKPGKGAKAAPAKTKTGGPSLRAVRAVR